MNALVYTRYGPPDVLQLKTVARPVPAHREVLVKVHATTVNRTDCAIIRAKPFFMRIVTGLLRPRKQIPGTEFAGEVAALGEGVQSLKIGDRVFGFDDEVCGAQAQFLAINEDNVVTIPANISYQQAAASSEGAHYAYSFIVRVNLPKGCRVLVNGATGAIGSAAVQLLKHFETGITATCPTKHVELVKSLGAARVIDYTREDFTRDGQKYDFVFDTVGKSSFSRCRRLLNSGGAYISSDLGFMAQNIFLPLITPIIKPLIGNRKTVFPTPINIRRSLLFIRELMEQGKFEAVIDQVLTLDKIIEAYRYVETGQKTGNVVISVAHDDDD